jgi:UDP-sulfoquinovose synthase
MSDDPRLRTRLDFDQAFGTAINRFSCQAVIGHPLTLYGAGGQVRGFLPLRDSMQCLALGLENPPDPGEYRVFNQFEETYSIRSLADLVREAALTLDLKVDVAPVENPRAAVERHDHHYAPDHERLRKLGYRPTRDIASEMRTMLADLLPHQERIAAHRRALLPDVHWDGVRRPVGFIMDGDERDLSKADPDTAIGTDASADAVGAVPAPRAPLVRARMGGERPESGRGIQ